MLIRLIYTGTLRTTEIGEDTVDGVIALAFAGLFAIILLSLNFSFLPAMRLRNMENQVETMMEQLIEDMEADKMIISELREILNTLDKNSRLDEAG
jgi:hypothetical protein